MTMMNDLSSTTFCCVDHHGLFIPLARAIAATGAKVYYQTPLDRRDSLDEGIIGDGMADADIEPIELVEDFWPIKNKVDCFVFPDVRHLGEQLELRSQGKSVWGAGRGMKLELNRLLFLEKLDELGLDVPPYEVVNGLDALRDHLKDKEDIYVKMSKWRGSWETFHWRSWAEDGHRFDLWGMRFGGIKNMLQFICFPKIETQLEIGADTFCVDGQWPSTMLHGIESKDAAYFSAVTKREDMPVELTHIMDAFSPFLHECEYRNQWSMEVRVADEGNFFLDATTRGGLPSTGSQIMAMSNLPEVIYHGARGEFVEPEYKFQFTAECMVKINGMKGSWETIVVPDELKPYLKLQDYCEVDGQPWFSPDEEPTDDIGWLVATGNTPTECLTRMNELSELLPDGSDAAVESLAEIIREIEAEQEQGIHFTDQKLPAPEIVLEPIS